VKWSVFADRTNGRAYATVLCPSVACNVCIVAIRCVLPKNCLKNQIENGLWRIEWSRDRRRLVALKGQRCDPNTFTAGHLEKSWRCYSATIANYSIVCFEAVRSAILATAWLLVYSRIYVEVSTQRRIVCFLTLWRQPLPGLSVRVSGCQKLQMTA